MNTSPIAELFDGIAPKYDALNHLLSFNIDKIWRRKTSLLVAKHQPDTILDLATGTADLAIALAKQNPQAHIIGMDISEKMMDIGKTKITQRGLENQIELRYGDAALLPFDDSSFNAVTVAFGVRNFDDREAGLREMTRVCREGGLVVVLEFSHPKSALVKASYRWYSRRWIPIIGRKVSKHPNAYSYLPSSVEAFPSVEDFKKMLEQAGLSHIQAKAFSGGIATLYYGIATKNGIKPQ